MPESLAMSPAEVSQYYVHYFLSVEGKRKACSFENTQEHKVMMCSPGSRCFADLPEYTTVPKKVRIMHHAFAKNIYKEYRYKTYLRRRNGLHQTD